MKLTIKFVKSYGTYCVFHGSRNLYSNSRSVLEALVWINKNHPKAKVVEKHATLGMVPHN